MLTELQQELFEERIAIMIYDGGVPEDEADALALSCVLDELPYEDNGQMELEI